MINLFDNYGIESKDLHRALLAAGIDNPTIVLNETGFLPENVESPYMYFVNKIMKTQAGYTDDAIEPLFFNEVPIPKFWEIKGDVNKAEVFEYNKLRAIIRYAAPNHLRLVNKVEWLDEHQRTRRIDYYNQYGWRYAQSTFDESNQMITTSYYTKQAIEVIVENHITQDIIVSMDKQIYVFKNKVEFIIFYLKESPYELDQITFNSLGTPFLVSHHLSEAGRDTLVWQENIAGEIPGNMRYILDKHTKRTQRIIVQTKDNYRKIANEYKDALDNQLFYIGKYYQYHLPSDNQKGALILTNSDNIENIELIIESAPEIELNIAALTTVSARLAKLEKYPNVKIYPNVKLSVLKNLIRKTKLYLDINHGSEVLDVIRTVFEHQKVILAFNQTAHSKGFIADELCFDKEDTSQFIEMFKSLYHHDDTFTHYLNLQLNQADVGTLEEYKQYFGEGM